MLPHLISARNHPLFSSQPHCPACFSASPLDQGAPLILTSRTNVAARSRPSHQTASQKKKGGKRRRIGGWVGRKVHLQTHTALKKCGKTVQTTYTLLCSWLESFLSSPANTKEKQKTTTMNKSYGGVPKPTVAPVPEERQRRRERRARD